MIRTILFDVGGTLERFRQDEEYRARGGQKILDLLAANGISVEGDPRELSAQIFRDQAEYHKGWVPQHLVELSPEEFCHRFLLRDKVADRDALAALGEPVCRILEDDSVPRVVRPDAKETLKALSERGYHLGVISNNMSRYQVFDGLERYGLRSYLRDITVSAVVGFVKPNPEIFRIALRQMQADPAETLYVGDSCWADMYGAANAGFGYTAFISKYNKDRETCPVEIHPSVEITELAELVPWLDSLKSRG